MGKTTHTQRRDGIWDKKSIEILKQWNSQFTIPNLQIENNKAEKFRTIRDSIKCTIHDTRYTIFDRIHNHKFLFQSHWLELQLQLQLELQLELFFVYFCMKPKQSEAKIYVQLNNRKICFCFYSRLIYFLNSLRHEFRFDCLCVISIHKPQTILTGTSNFIDRASRTINMCVQMKVIWRNWYLFPRYSKIF